MCIAIVKKSDKKVDKEVLATCFENNSDGAGFAYAQDGQIHIQKGYFTFDEFWEAFSQIPENLPTLVHFRIKTSGKLDAYNCHPWSVTDDVCIIHNGVINEFSFPNSPTSDTGLFVENVLRPLVERAGYHVLQEEFADYLISNSLGSSKMASLDKDGNFTIFNKSLGYIVDGVWFSNKSYESKSNKSFKESKSNPAPDVQTSDTRYCIYKRGRKLGVYKVGGSMRALTNKEVYEVRKQYNSKINKLVRRGILAYTELDANEDSEYQVWLENHSIYNVK